MMEFLVAHADVILATAGVGFNIFLLPTVWSQWRTRASTVSLVTSLTTVALLTIIILVFGALHLWVAMSADVVNAALWAIIGVQRVLYDTPRGTS